MSKSKPWWREQLQSKQFAQQQVKPDEAIDSDGWIFLKGGIDDTRKHLPPLFTAETAYYRNTKGMGPHISSADSKKQSKKLHKVRSTEKFVSGFDQRRETIKRIENELQSHPLALYSHLSDSIDPIVYEDVVRILDPEMKLAMDNNLTSIDNENDDESQSSGGSVSSKVPSHVYEMFYDQQAEGVPESKDLLVSRNPYLWDTTEEEDQLEEGHVKPEQPKLQSHVQDEEILSVTKQFCEWVASMGGDSNNNIDESTILSLFASGYDTKPTLSVPIQVVELNSIPPELRALAGGLERRGSATSRSAASKQSGPGKTLEDGHKSNTVKYRYGAWYLNAKTWKRMPVNEPLKDPKDQTGNEISEVKKKALELDHELAPMQGTRLFMQFVSEKDTRKPEFMENIERINAQKHQDQQRRQQAEQAKREKLLNRRKSSHANA